MAAVAVQQRQVAQLANAQARQQCQVMEATEVMVAPQVPAQVTQFLPQMAPMAETVETA